MTYKNELLFVFLLLSSLIGVNFSASSAVTVTSGATVEVTESDLSGFIESMSVNVTDDSVYGLRFSVEGDAVLESIQINEQTYGLTFEDNYYTYYSENQPLMNSGSSVSIAFKFSDFGSATSKITLSQEYYYYEFLFWSDYAWRDAENASDNPLTITLKESTTEPEPDPDITDPSLIISSVTPQTTTYYIEEVSVSDNAVANGNPSGGNMDFNIYGTSFAKGGSVTVVIGMNDYAAQYLCGIYVDTAAGNRFTNPAVTNNRVTFSNNNGSWTSSGALFAPNEVHEMRFQLKSSAPVGIAKFWIASVSYNGTTLQGNENDATYINLIEKPSYDFTVEQDKSYVGSGNKFEPLFRVRGKLMNGDVMPTIKFTPYFDEGMVDRICVFIRKVPVSGDIYYGDGFEDVGIFDYRHPLKSVDDYVSYAGYFNNPVPGEQLSFTVPESAMNVDLKSLLQSGNYYIYVTADVSEDAQEFVGDGYGTRNSIGAKLDELIVDGESREFQHVSYSNNYTQYIDQQEHTRIVLKQRGLLYRPYDGYSRYYRIPAITTASDGTLVTTSDARKYHNHDTRNDFDILSCYSTDEGKTWSGHTIIAQGTGWESDGNCQNSQVNGYGDCAISELPTPGNILGVFIGGAGLATPDGNGPTVYYSKSINSGASWWSEPKMIPQELIDAGNGVGNSLSNAVACPGPGRMCLIEGTGTSLDGKVVCCVYVWNNRVYTNCPLNFLAYDETTDTWTNVGTFAYQYNLSPGESQLAQIDEDTLILTCRDQTSQQIRTWHLVNVNNDGTLTVSSQLSYNNFSTGAGQCNSNFIVYEAGGKKYLIQAMPMNQTSSIGTDTGSTRQNIWIKYADLTDIIAGTSTTLNWLDGINITLNQGTGGYSCITRQLDGSVGVMVEEYPVAYRTTDAFSDCARGNGKNDVLLASWYMSVSIENITNGNVTADEIRQIVPPVIEPESTAVTLDDAKMFNKWNYNDSGVGNISVDESQIILNEGESYHVEYVVSLEHDGKSYMIETAQTLGENVSSGTFSLKTIVNDYLVANNLTLSKGDVITVAATTFVTNESGNVVAYSPDASEFYNVVDPGRKVMIKVMPASFNMTPRLITPVGEYGQNVEVYVSEGDVITLHQGAIPADMLAKFLGFSVNANAYETLNNSIFNVTTFDDASQINVVIPTIEAYEGDANNDNLIIFYAWYDDIQGGLYKHCKVYYDGSVAHSTSNEAEWHNEETDFNIDSFDPSQDMMKYPTNAVNTSDENLLYGYKGWYDYSHVDITLVPDRYTFRKTAVVTLWYLDENGYFACDSDAEGTVYRTIYGLDAAVNMVGDNPSERTMYIDESGNEMTAEGGNLSWFEGTAPKSVTFSFPTERLFVEKGQNAIVGKIITYIVDQPLTQEEADMLAEAEATRINNTANGIVAAALDAESVLYCVEQNIYSDNITDVSDIRIEDSVVVEGNSIIAPVGAEVYRTDGVRVANIDLMPGIYLVKFKTDTVKVIIR